VLEIIRSRVVRYFVPDFFPLKSDSLFYSGEVIYVYITMLQVKCTVCSHCSNTYDPFLDLSLEIHRADSLTKALSRFTAVDVLDGDNKYKCPRCKKKVRALKNFTIDLLPNILTIQFKRFSSTGGQGGKIDKKVEFGTTLDLKPFVSNSQVILSCSIFSEALAECCY
jgi:ubiquitin C-terminal hydrolase